MAAHQQPLPYDEKAAVAAHVEDVERGNAIQDDSSDKYDHDGEQLQKFHHNIDEGFDPKEVKRIIRKVDLRIIPMLAAMYCISLIDRTNLSLARSVNNKAMNTELELNVGDRYSIATMIFFIPYIIFEIPSQIGLRRFGVKPWLSMATFLWGIVMMCMGFVNTWGQLTALRAILGIFEASLFPGAAFIIACWYPRKSMALRSTLFYYTSTAIGGLSSILAWGISQMHGTAGYSGWRWIFILEGLMTVGIAILAWFCLQEFPDKATFLTPEESEIIKTRIQRDRGDAIPDPLTKAKCAKYVVEPKCWIFGIMFGGAAQAAYAMAYFLPTILQQMGFSNMESQLLYAPPKVFGIFPGIFIAWLVDKTLQRAAGVIFNSIELIIGVVMFSQLDGKVPQYIGTFLAFAGCSGNVSLILSWSQTSIRAQSKRGFQSAMVIAWGGIGGILAGVVFIEKESKQGYPTGIWTTIGLQIFTVLASIFFKFWFHYQNKRADRGEIVLEGHPDFRYQA